MKTMILAAGRGERLRPLTDHTPKPLIMAGKYRLIEHLIQALVAANLNEIIINYAHLGEQFPNTLGNGSQFGAKINYSPEIEGGLETAGGIIQALPLLGNEPFLVVNGDIWTDYDFTKLSNIKFKPSQLCHLVLVNNPSHNPLGDFALENNSLSTIENNKYTYSGIGLYHPEMFTGFPLKKMPLKPLLLNAIENNQASGELYEGVWSDIGTIERLTDLRSMLISRDT